MKKSYTLIAKVKNDLNQQLNEFKEEMNPEESKTELSKLGIVIIFIKDLLNVNISLSTKYRYVITYYLRKALFT